MTAFPRLVLDTNIVLALWHFADPALAPLAEAVARGGLALSSRDDALEELRHVLTRPRLGIAPERQARIIERYRGCLAPAPGDAGTFDLPQCRDLDDQKFLEIARDCGANHLLTRDKLLLKLNRHRLLRGKLSITTPERFLAETLRPVAQTSRTNASSHAARR
ncbi:MAG: PIN domain-containing protein [Azoarcus sp.]|jgi:predicted nucleic acid-binding protein|nr:PIN domain-containing protein [Azoarcus sp.]